MDEQRIKARVVQKHDTEENWLKATNSIPKQGELIIYDIDSTHDIERFKIGDGITSVNNLPFRSIDGGYDGLTEILSETTLNFTNNRSLTLTGCPSIEVGKKYTVTFYHPDTEPIEYELVGQSTSSGLIYIGNQKHTWGGTDTGEPFIIYSVSTSTTSPPIIYISSSETLPCTYNIKIKAIAPIKIEEKYLDIRNTNIVNGSAKGSLRTVGSTQENTSYKIGDYAFAEGSATQASGGHSHAEGSNTKALGSYSHAEGNNTEASGSHSHAEGDYTKASGHYSHAEGSNTKASGDYSHAEGQRSQASGSMSHAEGFRTTASSNYQHVQGKYNIEDSNNIYTDIIGNGKSDTERSNAATVDWNGNGWYAGDVYVGSTSGTNKDEGSKKLATEEYVNSAISSSIVVDSELSDTSENPVQNKVIKAYIDSITISDIDSIRNNATNGQTAYEMLNGVEALLSNI